MSLDKKRIPPPPSKTRVRKPITLQVKRRVLGKWKTHPVDRMVKIANFIESTNPEFAAKIWIRLLDSCELEENKKKVSSPPPVVGEETSSEVESLKLLEEMEQNGEIIPESAPTRLADGPTQVQVEAVPETDSRGHTKQ